MFALSAGPMLMAMSMEKTKTTTALLLPWVVQAEKALKKGSSVHI
jgi:hypothetical protein